MKNESLNRYQMILSTQSYLDSNSASWSAIPIINTMKTGLDDTILGIKEQLKSTGQRTEGLTISKNELKEQIAIKVSILSGALSAYASVSENQELLKDGSVTKSDIVSIRDAVFPEQVSSVSDLVSAHLAELADYGITEAQITNLNTSVDDFRELVGQPRLKRSAANLAKKAIDELISSGMEILNSKLDKVMLQFQFSNASFYEGYKKARVIVD
ncbi:hypothetical protein [Reichenbachiella versicolor]|uniref:hypothetical protein n=1 Tax=Reichenbachiella versicolor TaxID=1821036 RepID=UPI000D6E4FEF|nr:hypothetical protein [Reichenbachiella versicolor]